MKLFGSTENKITEDKNGENVPHPEIIEITNIFNNDYQDDSRIFHTFVSNQPFGNLILIFNSKFYNEIDGIVMVSRLAPILVNILMGFHESKWLNEYKLNKSIFFKDMLMSF